MIIYNQDVCFILGEIIKALKTVPQGVMRIWQILITPWGTVDKALLLTTPKSAIEIWRRAEGFATLRPCREPEQSIRRYC